MTRVAIVDYGVGNLYSVAKAVERSAARVHVTSDPREIAASDKVIFPGQGAARDCMTALQKLDLQSAIIDALRHKPFLGICMGMQVLMQQSEEGGGTECLAFYRGSVEYFGNHFSTGTTAHSFKVPHMGWNRIEQRQRHPLWEGIPGASYFYFAHGYFVKCDETELVAGATDYGLVFTSALARDNVFALQCHPEKSAAVGLRLLDNFVHWDGNGVETR